MSATNRTVQSSRKGTALYVINFVIRWVTNRCLKNKFAVRNSAEQQRFCNGKGLCLLYGYLACLFVLYVTYVAAYIASPMNLLFLYAKAPKFLQGWTMWMICGVVESGIIIGGGLSCFSPLCKWVAVAFPSTPWSQWQGKQRCLLHSVANSATMTFVLSLFPRIIELCKQMQWSCISNICLAAVPPWNSICFLRWRMDQMGENGNLWANK